VNKTELLQKLQDIEWDDFEVKEARSEFPKNVWETVSAFEKRKIEENISKLKSKGLLERVGADKGGYWRVTG